MISNKKSFNKAMVKGETPQTMTMIEGTNLGQTQQSTKKSKQTKQSATVNLIKHKLAQTNKQIKHDK